MSNIPLLIRRVGATADELATSVLRDSHSSRSGEDSSHPSPVSALTPSCVPSSGEIPSRSGSQRNRSGYSVRWSSPVVTAHQANTPEEPFFSPLSSLPVDSCSEEAESGASITLKDTESLPFGRISSRSPRAQDIAELPPSLSFHTAGEGEAPRVHFRSRDDACTSQCVNSPQKGETPSSGRSKNLQSTPRYQSSGAPELVGPLIVSRPSSSQHSPPWKTKISFSSDFISLPLSQTGMNADGGRQSGRLGVRKMSGSSTDHWMAENARESGDGRPISSSIRSFLLSGKNPSQMMRLTGESPMSHCRSDANDSGRSRTQRANGLDPRRLTDHPLLSGEGDTAVPSNESRLQWNGKKTSESMNSLSSSLWSKTPACSSGITGPSQHRCENLSSHSYFFSKEQKQLSSAMVDTRHHLDKTNSKGAISQNGNGIVLRKELINQLDSFMLAHCAHHIAEPQRSANFRKILADLSAATPTLAPLLLNVSRHLKEVTDNLQQMQQSHKEALAQQEKELFQKFVNFFEEKIYEIVKEKKKAEMNSKRLEEEALDLRYSRDEELMRFKEEMMIKLNNCEKREEEFHSFRALIASVFQSNQRLIARSEELEDILRKHRIDFPVIPSDTIDVRTSALAEVGRRMFFSEGTDEKNENNGKNENDGITWSSPNGSTVSFSTQKREERRRRVAGSVGWTAISDQTGGSADSPRIGISHRHHLNNSASLETTSTTGQPYYRNISSQVPIDFMKASSEEMSAARLTLQKELLNCAFDERTAYRLEVNKLKSDNSELQQYIKKLEDTVTELHRYIHEKRFLCTDDTGETPLTPRPRDIPFSIQPELGIDLRKHTGEIMTEMGAISISLKHQLNSALLRLRQMVTVTEWMQEDTLVAMDEEVNGKGGVLPTIPVSAWSSVPHFLRTHVHPDVPNLKWSESDVGAIMLDFFKHYKELYESCWGYRDRKMLRPHAVQLFERRLSPLVVLDVTPETLFQGKQTQGEESGEEVIPFGYVVSQFIRHYLMTLTISHSNRSQRWGGEPLRPVNESPPPHDDERSSSASLTANIDAGATSRGVVGVAATSAISSPTTSSVGSLALPGTLHATYSSGNAEHVVELEFTRMAYNLWWAANRYSSTQPLCYLFVAVVHGKLPVKVFDDMQQCLTAVASCAKLMDADGSGTFTYPKLVHGVQRMVVDLGVNAGRSAILACVQVFEENNSPLFGGRVNTAALLSDESTILVSNGGADSQSSPTKSEGAEGCGGGTSGAPFSSSQKSTPPPGGGKAQGSVKQIHISSHLPPRITATKLPFRSEQPPGASVFCRFWRRLVIQQYEFEYSALEELLSPLVVESEVVFGLYVLPIPEALYHIQQYDKIPSGWEAAVREMFFPSSNDRIQAVNLQEASHSWSTDSDGDIGEAKDVVKKVMTSTPSLSHSSLTMGENRNGDPLSTDVPPEGGSEAFSSLIREQGVVHRQRWTAQRERMEQVFEKVIHRLPRLNRSVHFPFTAAVEKISASDEHAVGRLLRERRKRMEASSTIFSPEKIRAAKGEGQNSSQDGSLPLSEQHHPFRGFTQHTPQVSSPNSLLSPITLPDGLLLAKKNENIQANLGNHKTESPLNIEEKDGTSRGRKKQKQYIKKSSRGASFSTSVPTVSESHNNKNNSTYTSNSYRYPGSSTTRKKRRNVLPASDRGDKENIVIKKDSELVEWYSFVHELHQRSLPFCGKLCKWSMDTKKNLPQSAP